MIDSRNKKKPALGKRSETKDVWLISISKFTSSADTSSARRQIYEHGEALLVYNAAYVHPNEHARTPQNTPKVMNRE